MNPTENSSPKPISMSHFCDMSNFVNILRFRAQYQPQQLAYTFIQSDEVLDTLTYGALDLQVRVIAAKLQIKAPIGSRVLLAYQPGLDFAVAFLACLYAGMIAVPAYGPKRNQKSSRLRSIVASASISLVLTTSHLDLSVEQFSREDQALFSLERICTDQILGYECSGRSEWQDEILVWKEPEINSKTIAFLQYTSGSTGEPKGVMVSHGNLIHNSSLIASCFEHTEKSRGVIWLPPYHDMGLIGGILQPLYAGFPVYLMSPLDFLQKPLRWLQTISLYGATTSGGPNFAYELAVKKATPKKLEGLDLSSWRVAFTGAEPIRAQTLDRFTEVFEPFGFRREAFYPCYGMAETTLIVSGGQVLSKPVVKSICARSLEDGYVKSISTEMIDRRFVVSCGESRQKVRIVDIETFSPCKNNQVGEIWVAGDSVAQGYWNQPKKTNECFQAYLKSNDNSVCSEGPYLRTGDLGFINGDQLYVTGRAKDLIIIRGQNHYPHDIELTAENSHSDLKAGTGAAFSIELNEAEQLVIVYEVKRSYLRKINNQQEYQKLSEAVFRCIRKNIAANHSLETYAIALIKPGTILKTSSGKIRRYAIKKAFLNGELSIVSDWSRDPRRMTKFRTLQNQIDNMIQKISNKKPS